MSNISIPTCLEDLTPEWLTSALRSGGYNENTIVTGANIKDIGAGVGTLSTIGRVELEYENPEPDVPATMIAKVQSKVPEILMAAIVAKFYKREVDFYRFAAPISVLRVPRAYYLDIDDTDQNFVLLLEDFGEVTFDQVRSVPSEASYKALMELARYHAQFSPKVLNNELKWALDSAADDRVAILVQLYQNRLESALNKFNSHFNIKTKKCAEALSGKIPALLQNRRKEGLTLIHGDYRLDNLFMGKLPHREGFPEVGLGVVDWQLNFIAECGFDVAYHMCCIDVEARRKLETEVLKDYHRTLVEEGVEGYSFEYFQEQYRRYILISFLYAVGTAANANPENERSMKLAKSYLDRVMTAIEDNGSWDLI